MAEMRKGAGGKKAGGEEDKGPQKIKIMTFLDVQGERIFDEPDVKYIKPKIPKEEVKKT